MSSLKKNIIRRNFGQYAGEYEQKAKLQMRVAEELIAQCKDFSGAVLDLGAGPGIIAKKSGWEVTSLDLAFEMCRYAGAGSVNADIEALPFADESFANITSSLSLQWAADFELALAEIKRVLKPGGKLAFTTFSPESLKDLRLAFSYLDADMHLMEFTPVIKLFAQLKKTGFTNLVMSTQKITYYYPDILSALRSIKNIGASYGYSAHKSLRGRKYFARLENAHKSIHKEDRVPLEWEVVYIHAEK